MVMILFNATDTIFTSNGVKSIETIFTHEIRNAKEWYLDCRVPLDFVEFIKNNEIVFVETNEKGGQPFRIKNIEIGSDIRFRAYHVGFDTKDYTISVVTVVNANCQSAMQTAINSTQPRPFTVFSNISGLRTFGVNEMSLFDALNEIARQYNGVIDFDGFELRIVTAIGSDKGVTVEHGKNLEGAEIIENWDKVVTELRPLGNNNLVGTTRFSSFNYGRVYAKIVHFDTDDLTTLNNLAGAYLSRFERPEVNYTVQANIECGLGDTIQVIARQFTIFTQVIGFKFNIKTRKMIEVEFGNFSPTARNVIEQLREEIVEKSQGLTQLKIDEINGEISTVVSNVSNLTGRVTNAETSITQNANQIALKADQTTVNGINTRLNTAEQLITPTAITQTVRSSTEYTNDLAGKVSSSDLATTLTNYSTQTQTADKIEIEIGKVQIGGKNELTNALRLGTAKITGSGIIDLNHNDCPNGFFLVGDSSASTVFRIPNVITSNGWWTVSFDIRGSQSVPVSVTVYINDAPPFARLSTNSNNTWMRVSMSVNVTNHSSIHHFVDFVPDWADIFIKDIKIEKGNKATEFTHANNEMRTAKYTFDGSKARFYGDGQEWYDNNGNLKVSFDTVNNRFIFKGQVEADSGLIGRFAISGQDLVYTSELFNKDYDYSDLIKLHRILLGFESQTSYDLAVYDFNNSGTLNISDLSTLDSFINLGTPLPTPLKQIRSVVRIGTNNGAITTQAVAENGSAGTTTTIRGEKVSGDLINANLIGAKGSNISQMSADGLSFSGVGSINNRTLDDYEEGIWEPTVVGTTNLGVGTYTARLGRYTKIGNIVHFFAEVSWTAHTGTGALRINNLPFLAANVQMSFPASVVSSNLTYSGQVGATVQGNTTNLNFHNMASNTATSFTAMDTNASIWVQGTYMV